MRKQIIYVAAIASALCATSCDNEEPEFVSDILNERNDALRVDLTADENYALTMYANAFSNATEDYQSAANYLASAEKSLAELIANPENFDALSEQIDANNVDITIEKKNIEKYKNYTGYRSNYEELVALSITLKAECDNLYNTLKALGSNKSTEYQSVYEAYSKAMAESEELGNTIMAASYTNQSIKNCERIIRAKIEANEILLVEIEAKSYMGGLRALRNVITEYQNIADDAADSMIKAKQAYESYRISLN